MLQSPANLLCSLSRRTHLEYGKNKWYPYFSDEKEVSHLLIVNSWLHLAWGPHLMRVPPVWLSVSSCLKMEFNNIISGAEVRGPFGKLLFGWRSTTNTSKSCRVVTSGGPIEQILFLPPDLPSLSLQINSLDPRGRWFQCLRGLVEQEAGPSGMVCSVELPEGAHCDSSHCRALAGFWGGPAKGGCILRGSARQPGKF